MSAIIPAADCSGLHEAGAKGWSLALAQRAGIDVPPWFAVSPAAASPAAGLGFSESLRPALASAVALLAPHGELLAVRSSALDEDGARHSFAGQLRSFLFVPAAQVAERVAEVRRSALSPPALAYRRHHGIAGEAAAPAVLVQRMVRAETAGIAFSADPVSGRRGLAVVVAGRGVAEGIVSGARDGDTWHVERSGRIEHRALAGAGACLDEAEVREVAALARRCEHCFGAPQDIEWAREGGRLWLLQSRPITSIAALPDPDGEIALWDSSNIAESYGGVTTPLTFSFIRRNYEHVYRELMRLGGVSAEAIDAHEDALRRMLGLVRGRVYYNLISWYRLLALVPGFAHNRRFLDRMLGVGEEAARALLEAIAAEARRAVRHPWRDAAGQAIRMAFLFLTVEARNRRFRRRLDEALAAPTVPFEDMRDDELAAQFRAIERRLLKRWDAPLVNDFFAMVFHGLLACLVERWCGPQARGLDNDLLAGEPDIVSLEPARRLHAMAREAAMQPALAAMLREAAPGKILAAMSRSPALDAQYRAYLARFGDRCFEELKLESPSLAQDPLPLLRAIGQLAANPERCARTQDAAQAARSARARLHAALAGHPLRRLALLWILGQARARVRDRENLRFERTRLYGRVRRIYAQIGRRLNAFDRLQAPGDVFFLEMDEVLRYLEGAATCTDLKALAALRRAEFARHRAAERPPERFETRGVAFEAMRVCGPAMPPGTEEGELRRATGCGPGTVRGLARVVTHPESARLAPGDILVAERTDPGWVMLFAAASGLVIERGSLLSHAAIVAREMGIPAVVGLRGACRWLRDGDWIEVDGSTGVVRRLGEPPLRSAA